MSISSSSVSTSVWGIVRFNRRDRISTWAEADDQIRRRIIDLAEKAVLWFECAGYEALLLQPKNRAASIDLSRIDRDGCCDSLGSSHSMSLRKWNRNVKKVCTEGHRNVW